VTRAHGLTRYKYGPDEHGTEGKGCRCGTCRDRAGAYEQNRDRMIAYGRWQPFVPAGRARAHAAWLRSCGLGPEQIGRLAGVSGAGIAALLDGRPGCRPTRRVRPGTEAAILAVRPALDMMSPGTLVDAAGTRRRVQALAFLGWTVQAQGQMAGVKRLSVAITHDHVTAAVARKVRDLYDRTWRTPPPEDTPAGRKAARRTRNRARRLGWASPLAWDDGSIDDPAAKPSGMVPLPQIPSGSPVLGAAIRAARERAGLSQQGLASVVGLSRTAIQHYEEARRTPNAETWIQLELTLGPLGVVRPGAVQAQEAATEGQDAAA
jgi:DNA-binding XRE family transcriptional regulator